LQLVDHYFLVSSIDDDLHHINYGQLVWMALCLLMSFRREVNPLLKQD
jgi:hypothetical protein